MNTERTMKQSLITIEQIFPVVGCPPDFDFHGKSAIERFALMSSWVDIVCKMPDSEQDTRVKFGEFLYEELTRTYREKERELVLKKREENVTELESKLPEVRELVRTGVKAFKDGNTDISFDSYLKAFILCPYLPRTGMKAAIAAFGKNRLIDAQKLSNKICNVNNPSHWVNKAKLLNIGCHIRRAIPWLKCGLAPRTVLTISCEGAYICINELTVNPVIRPYTNLSEKTKEFFASPKLNSKRFITIIQSTVDDEDDPYCYSDMSPVMTLHDAMASIPLLTNPCIHHESNSWINSIYEQDLSEFLKGKGIDYQTGMFRVVDYTPVWNWFDSYFEVNTTKEIPGMHRVTALINAIRKEYREQLIEERRRNLEDYSWLDNLQKDKIIYRDL